MFLRSILGFKNNYYFQLFMFCNFIYDYHKKVEKIQILSQNLWFLFKDTVAGLLGVPEEHSHWLATCRWKGQHTEWSNSKESTLKHVFRSCWSIVQLCSYGLIRLRKEKLDCFPFYIVTNCFYNYFNFAHTGAISCILCVGRTSCLDHT